MRYAKFLTIFSLFSCAALVSGGCSSSDKTSDEDEAILEVKAYIQAEIEQLEVAAIDLQNAAPAPDADGWNCETDAAACDAMKVEWKKARIGYERIEGAIAVLFPNIDAATDERYDGFIAECTDENLFDDQCVTGVHAIERILYADSHPEAVVQFEQSLSGYQEASFPATEAEATAFKTSLVQKLVTDFQQMKSEFSSVALDSAAAFRGVMGSMLEQLEKAELASTGEDESRYGQHTLSDMRGNLQGGQSVFSAFETWLENETGNTDLQDKINVGFTRLDERYQTLAESYGDSLPPVPVTWNGDSPSEADAATDYGQLHALLIEETDPENEAGLLHVMGEAADALGIPQLPE